MDSLRGIATSLNHALALSGLPVHPHDAVRGFIGNGSRILIRRATPADADETLVNTVERAFKSHYDLAWQDGTVVYPGITGLLESLQTRGHPLAVLSNKPHPFTETIVARLFPTIRFFSVLGQRAGIPHKPDPVGALEIANALSLAPEHCTVIGDSTMDIETARNAGMRVFAVTWGYHDRQCLAAAGSGLIADDPAALLELLANRGKGRLVPSHGRDVHAP